MDVELGGHHSVHSGVSRAGASCGQRPRSIRGCLQIQMPPKRRRHQQPGLPARHTSQRGALSQWGLRIARSPEWPQKAPALPLSGARRR